MKKFSFVAAILIMLFLFTSCTDAADSIPSYPAQEFEISALSGPQEMTKEAFLQYKNAGLNTFAFSIHNGIYDSENRYYLGSKLTEKALELCKDTGLYAYVAYGDSWATYDIEGEDYFSDTPFSQHNYYGEYIDIIRGIRIIDEPKKEKMLELADDILINDFKQVYSDKKYMINLIPSTAVTSRDFADYDEMLEIYGKNIMSKFENPYISVDVYPFSKNQTVETMMLYNYNEIAKAAKKYKADTTMILQASTGNEFLDELSIGDVRFQAYAAIAFGADNLQYYCYCIPKEIPYNYCMLEKDNKTPSQLYYDIKIVNQEIQNFADAVLAYDWEQSIGIEGSVDQTFRVSTIKYDENFEVAKIKNAKHYVDATATQDLVVSQFKSDKYGEAYMFVNFARAQSDNNVVNITFKECKAIAIYGGVGYDGIPKIVELDENGKITIELEYGEGVFVTPIA